MMTMFLHVTVLLLISVIVECRMHRKYSPCSESLPEYQRMKRNCIPLKPMKLHLLKHVVCNDGSPAGYYLRRRKTASKSWLIYLEGGGYCYDKRTCMQREFISRRQMFSLISLNRSSRRKFVSGILSTQRRTNPLWWNANHVYVPYCSSDIWIGNNQSKQKDGFIFLGARIIDAVVDDLWKKRGLKQATNLTLAGSSAGGTGVMFNIDRLGDTLEKRGSKAQVRGIVDSGWFVDNDQIVSRDCGFPNGSCKPSDTIKAAMNYWNADLPESCTKIAKKNEQHMCLFGNKIYPTLKRPIFVIQWIYDLAQIIEDNPELQTNPEMLLNRGYFRYMSNLGHKMRKTMANVSSLFAPSCLGHTVITKEYWMETRIGKWNLLDALKCWLSDDSSSICRYLDKCDHPHCSRYCSNIVQTSTGEISIRRLPTDFTN